MSAADDVRLDAIDTPEGRAIYPFGAWGAGYIADAATERRLRVYLTQPLRVMLVFFVLQGFVREFFLRAPELVAIAATYLAILIFHYAAVRVILRGCRRAAYRPSSRELLRLRYAKGGRLAIVFAHWCCLVVLAAIAVMIAILTEGKARWGFEAACAVFAVLVVINLRRLETILG